MYRSSSKTFNFQSKSKLDKKDDKSCVITPNSATTPGAARKSLADEECLSPIQIRCTQDGIDDDVDVIWDWHSPQTRPKKTYNRQRKRPLNNISPQIPRKIQSKNNLIPKFTSLKAELEKLNRTDEQSIPDEINLPFNESFHYNDNFDTNKDVKDPTNAITEQLEGSDLFGDDSFDEEMIKCSQQVEEAFVKPENRNIQKLLNGHNTENIADDSFDAILEDFTEEDIARFSQESNETKQEPKCVTPIKNTSSSRTIYRTHSTPVRSDRLDILPKNHTSISTRSGVLPRTKSANDCGILSSPESPIITCSPEEIEKKRNEAKARLELKRTQNEIEKKRLEALERLKRNRMQRNNNTVTSNTR